MGTTPPHRRSREGLASRPLLLVAAAYMTVRAVQPALAGDYLRAAALIGVAAPLWYLCPQPEAYFAWSAARPRRERLLGSLPLLIGVAGLLAGGYFRLVLPVAALVFVYRDRQAFLARNSTQGSPSTVLTETERPH